MTKDTKQLIQELAERSGPVRRNQGPVLRALIWAAVSLTYIGFFVVLMPAGHGASPNAPDYVCLMEQLAALTTGVMAAIAAFVSVVPGYSRNWMLLPSIPFAVWLASLGPGCVRQWNQYGFAHLPLSHDPWCV